MMKYKYIPIIFFEFYLSFTVLLFAFGPWDYKVDNGLILYSYLIGAQLALYIGYQIGLKRINANTTINSINEPLRRALIGKTFPVVYLPEKPKNINY